MAIDPEKFQKDKDLEKARQEQVMFNRRAEKSFNSFASTTQVFDTVINSFNEAIEPFKQFGAAIKDIATGNIFKGKKGAKGNETEEEQKGGQGFGAPGQEITVKIANFKELLEPLQKSIIQGSLITSSFIAATKGLAEIKDIGTFLTNDYDKLIGKASQLYKMTLAGVLKAKGLGEGKVSGKDTDSNIAAIGKGEAKLKIPQPKIDVKAINLMDLLNKLFDPKFADEFFKGTAEYTKFNAERMKLQADIDKEEDPVKKARMQDKLSNMQYTGKSKAEMILALVQDVTASIIRLGDIKYVSYRTAFKLKTLDKLGLPKILGAFLHSFHGIDKNVGEAAKNISEALDIILKLGDINKATVKSMFMLKTMVKTLKPGEILSEFFKQIDDSVTIGVTRRFRSMSNALKLFFEIFEEVTLKSYMKVALALTIININKKNSLGAQIKKLLENIDFEFPYISTRGLSVDGSDYKGALIEKVSTITEVFEHLEKIPKKMLWLSIKLFKTGMLSWSIGHSITAIIHNIVGSELKRTGLAAFGKENLELVRARITTFSELLSKIGDIKITKLKLFDAFLNSKKSGFINDSILGKTKTKFTLFVEGLAQSVNTLKDTKPEEIKKFHKVVETITNLSGIIIKLAIAAPLVGIARLSVMFLGALMKKIEGFAKDDKKLEQGVHTIQVLGKGLVSFGIGLVVFSKLVTMVDFKQVAIGLVYLTMISGAMWLVSMIDGGKDPNGKMGAGGKDGRLEKAAKAMAWMGIGLLSFGIGLYVFTTLLQKIDISQVFLGIAVLAGYTLAFLLVSLIDKRLKDAAIGFTLMSLSLIVFGVGLWLYTSVINSLGSKIWMGLLVLAAGTLLFAVIGLLEETKILKKGSIAVMLMGVSLIVFSIGLTALAGAYKVISSQEGWWWKLPLLLAGAVGLFTAIGALAGTGVGGAAILLGVAAVTAMGISMLAFSLGLVALGGALKIFDSKTIDNFPTIMGKIGEGFMAVITGDPKAQKEDKGFLGNLLDSTVGVAKRVASLYLAIPAVLGMGVALVSLSWGLSKAAEFNWKDFAENKAPFIFPVIDTLAKSFAAVGDAGSGRSGGVLGFLTGIKLGPNAAESGIKATLKAGEALTSVAEGLRAFEEKTKGINFGDVSVAGTGGNVPLVAGTIQHKIFTALSAINSGFSAIGASGNTNQSWMGLLFGVDFKPSDTEVGIKSVLKSGEALKSVAQGILDFNNITKGIDIGATSATITWVVTEISKAFAAVGAGNSNMSLLKVFIGTDFGSTDVERGIASVRDMGKILKDTAEGLKHWNDINKTGLDFKGISTNISVVLDVISNAFRKIGSKGAEVEVYDERLGINVKKWVADLSVERGIKAVTGAGGILKDVAEGIKGFADLKKIGITIDDLGPDGTIGSNITSILTVISDAFKKIGSAGVEMDVWDEQQGKNVKRWVPDAAVKRGVEAVKGVGSELKNIAEGIKVFIDIDKAGFKKEDLGAKGRLGSNIKAILTTVSEVFRDIGYGGSKDSQGNWLPNDKGIKMGLDSVKGVGDELKKIADGLKAYMSLEKEGFSVNKIKTNISGILKTVVNVLAGIGGNEQYWKEAGMGTSTPPSPEQLNTGKNQIRDMANSFEPVINIVNTFNKIDYEKWNQRKNIISEFSGGLNTLMNMAKTQNIPDKTRKNMDEFVRFIERYSWVADPFARFTKSFKDHLSDMRELIKMINTIDLVRFGTLSNLSKIHLDLVKTDSREIATKLQQLKEYMSSISQATIATATAISGASSQSGDAGVMGLKGVIEYQMGDLGGKIVDMKNSVIAVLDRIQDNTDQVETLLGKKK